MTDWATCPLPVGSSWGSCSAPVGSVWDGCDTLVCCVIDTFTDGDNTPVVDHVADNGATWLLSPQTPVQPSPYILSGSALHSLALGTAVYSSCVADPDVTVRFDDVYLGPFNDFSLVARWGGLLSGGYPTGGVEVALYSYTGGGGSVAVRATLYPQAVILGEIARAPGMFLRVRIVGTVLDWELSTDSESLSGTETAAAGGGDNVGMFWLSSAEQPFRVTEITACEAANE